MLSLPLPALLLALPTCALADEASIDDLAGQALDAYNKRELQKAYELYSKLIDRESDKPVWSERRGQVAVDLKRFTDAISDFDQAEAAYRNTVDPTYVSLGLLSNRALAHEGLYQWDEAIANYDKVRRARTLPLAPFAFPPFVAR